MRNKPPSINSAEVEQSRAALAALFGDAPPASTSASASTSSTAQAAATAAGTRAGKDKAGGTVTAKIDTLRRKREAREALLAAAAAHGITLEELQALVSGDANV
jgi:hypothetical protein